MSWMMIAMVVLVVLEGVSVMVAPWVTRRTVCFGVSVPASAQEDREIRRIRIGYTVWAGLATVAAVAASLCCALLWGATGGLIAVTVASLALIVISFVLILGCRKQVRFIKQDRGWKAKRLSRAAFLVENAGPEPLGMRWELLHVMPLLAAVVLSFALYDDMPSRLATHANAAGQVDGWSDKSMWVVLGLPLLVQLVMVAAMAASHAAIIYSPRQIDPERPSVSNYAYGQFARAWSVFVLVAGIALNLGFAGLIPSYANWWTLDEWGSAMMLVALAVVVAALVLSVTLGQCGSLIGRTEDEREDGGGDAMADDDDNEWVLGVFYFSRENPAIVVPKRMGIGYTLNMARPLVWLICAVLALALIAAIAVPLIA